MTNHTPGPWVVIEGRFAWTIGKWPYIIAEISNVAEYKANARLIAAAPDLLAALQACDEAMEYMSEYDIPITLPEQVKAAIKKATGEE